MDNPNDSPTLNQLKEFATELVGAKPKRKRKEWVYKSEYDKLYRKFVIALILAGAELIAFLIALRIAL